MGDQTLYLRWSDHHLTILRLLSIIRDKEQYCDATIMCEGRVFPVHRIVLAMCSSYFENIFNKLDCKNPVIVLADIKAAYLEVLLSYMYSGEATILQRCVSGVLHTASVLKVKGLSEDADDHTDVNLYGEAIPNIQYNQKLSTKNTVLSVQQEKECRNGSADFDSQPAASKQMRQTELSRQTVSSFLVREGTPEINENSEGSLTHSSTLSIVPDSEISLVQSNLVSQNLGELLSLNSVKGDSCHEALMLWRENLLSQDSTHERQTSNTDSAMDHSNKSIVEEIDIKNEIIELLPEECNVNGVGNSMNIDCLHCTRTYSSNQANDMEGICTSRDQNNIPVAATFQDNRVSQNISPGDVCQTEVVRAVLKQELSGTCIVNGHEDNDVGVAKNSMVVCNGGIASNNSRNLQDPEECYSFPSMTTEDNMEPDDTANCSNCQEHKNGHQSCPEITINNDHNNTALGVSHRAPIDNIFTKSKKNSDANALKSLSGTNHTPEPVKRRRGRPRKLPMVKNEKSGRWAKIVPVVKKERVQPRMVLAVKERGRTKKLETVLSAASSRCIEIHRSRIKNVDLRENADQQFRRETSHRLTRSSTSSKKIVEKADKRLELCENVCLDSDQSLEKNSIYSTLLNTNENDESSASCIVSEVSNEPGPRLNNGYKEEPFACSLCLYTSSSEETLNKHICIHLKDDVYVCRICSFSSKYLKTANRHACTKRKEHSIVCALVSESHEEMSHFTHKGKNSYSCDKCSYKSVKASDLIYHALIHEKPFACEQCYYRCKTNARLKAHRVIHTGEKPFSCRFCSYEGNQYYNMLRHERKMHSREFTIRKFKNYISTKKKISI